MSVARLCQWQDCPNPRLELTGVDERGHAGEIVGRDLHEKKRRVYPVLRSPSRLGLRHGGDQRATSAQNLEGAGLRLASDQIEDGVDLLRLVFETPGLIIQRLIGA